MVRSQVVLMAMASRVRGTRFDPVRIQKLLFLIDREAGTHVDGPHFDFRPYLYGPFDRAVFDELDALRHAGEVVIHGTGRYRAYILTESGHERGTAALNELAEPVRRYVADVAHWVLSLPFGELLSAVYHSYPDMAVNSIVPEVTVRFPKALNRSPLPPFLSGMARTLDLAGMLDPYELDSGDERDTEAIDADWRAVGDDLRSAVASFGYPLDSSNAS